MTLHDQFFESKIRRVISLTREVIDTAAELRARYGFKTPDAIHLAAAIISDCEVFLTNDHRLDRCAEIKVEVLD